MNIIENTDEEILAIAHPMWDDLIKYSNKGQYGKFIRKFSYDLLLGLNVHLANGLFLSGAWRTNLNYDVTSTTSSGFNFRVGYHPGIHSK